MRRPTKYGAIPILLSATAALVVWLTAAATVAATPSGLTSLDVRDQFTRCGYEIANPGAPARSQYVVVEDPGAALVRGTNYRIVMAIVYPDAAAAIAAHLKAQLFADSGDVLFATDQPSHGRRQAGTTDGLGAARQADEVRAFTRRELEDLGQTHRELARRSALVRLELPDGVHRTTAPVRDLGLAQVEVTAQAWRRAMFLLMRCPRSTNWAIDGVLQRG